MITYQFVLYHRRCPLRVLLMLAIDSQAMFLHRKWIKSRKLPLSTSLPLLKLLRCSSCRAPLGDVPLGLEHETFNGKFQVVATFLHILFDNKVWFLEFAQYGSISLLISISLWPFDVSGAPNDRMFPNMPEMCQMAFSTLWKPVWLIWSCLRNYLSVRMS